MNATQKFGVTDIARMLESISSRWDEGHPETTYVLRRLIEHSPSATALHERLHTRQGDGPSLNELARLLITVEDGDVHAPAVYTARWLIEQSPAATERLAQLEQMATDASFADDEADWLIKGLETYEKLDRLLATLDDWQDAGEELGLKGARLDYSLRTMLKACRARVARARGSEREHLERLRRRLQDAARRKIRISDPEVKLQEVIGSLRSKLDPATALETVERLTRHLSGD